MVPRSWGASASQGWQDGRESGWQDGRMAGWQDGRDITDSRASLSQGGDARPWVFLRPPRLGHKVSLSPSVMRLGYLCVTVFCDYGLTVRQGVFQSGCLCKTRVSLIQGCHRVRAVIIQKCR